MKVIPLFQSADSNCMCICWLWLKASECLHNSGCGYKLGLRASDYSNSSGLLQYRADLRVATNGSS